MSHNIFHIDPIFFLPIDLEDNSKNKEEVNPKISIINDFKEYSQKNKLNIENESTNEDSSFGKELDDQSQDEIKSSNTKNNKEQEKEIIVFSKSVNDRHIKSMTNSSKIYICEIFKQNWKLKVRRLITKLKKKLIKEYNNSFLKEVNKQLNINNKIYNNYINNNFIDINIINGTKDDYIYKNKFINNSNRMYNNVNDNINCIFGNINSNNLGINSTKLNNNFQIDINPLINNINELDQFKKLLILNNIFY